MDGTIDPTIDYIESLSQRLGQCWPTIAGARDSAKEVLKLLSQSLSEREFGGVASADLDLIAFGSLARREWTSGSDVDWVVS